jgi:hypothetical protein
VLLRLRDELRAITRAIRLQRLQRDLKVFNPNQPAGSPEGGQWTSAEGATAGGSADSGESDVGEAGIGETDTGGTEGEESVPELIRVAGPGDPPEVPRERPNTPQERNRIGRDIARWGGAIGTLLRAIPWLQENAERVDAYRDPPKTLEELQQALEPKRGYDVHHIVEQGSAEQDGFPRSQIDAPENLARIPTYKHWDITGWYQTKNDQYGGLSPREYLRGRSWDDRRQIGLKALIDFGVLRP